VPLQHLLRDREQFDNSLILDPARNLDAPANAVLTVSRNITFRGNSTIVVANVNVNSGIIYVPAALPVTISGTLQRTVQDALAS